MEDIMLRGFLKKLKYVQPHLGAPVKIEKIFEPIWDYLTDGEKRALGKLFYDRVTSQKIPGVVFVKKNAAGRAYYKII